jgi:hypothetical protein
MHGGLLLEGQQSDPWKGMIMRRAFCANATDEDLNLLRGKTRLSEVVESNTTM